MTHYQFINLISGANLKVSTAAKLAGPPPCTQTVNAAPDFNLDGYTVRLVDTPGFINTGFIDIPPVANTPGFVDTPWFDNTDRNDVEVFRMIAQFLNATRYAQLLSVSPRADSPRPANI